jgi:hypothetical protein
MGSYWQQMAEIDFGSVPVSEMTFTVADSHVTPTCTIVGNVAYVAPTGKDLDEMEMDCLDLKFAAGNGQLTIYAKARDGDVADKFKIAYCVSFREGDY